MAVSFDSSTYGEQDNTTGGITINVPANTDDNELLIVSIGQQDTGISEAIDLDAAFTDIASAAGNATACPMMVGRRLASSEPASYSHSGGRGHGYHVLVTGADTSSPIDDSAAVTSSGSDPAVPSVTTTVDDCLLITFIDKRTGNAIGGTPTGWTLGDSDTVGAGPTIAFAYMTQASAGEMTAANWDWTNTAGYGAVTIAIKPPSGVSIPVIMHHRRHILGC